MIDYYDKNSSLDRSAQLAGVVSLLEHRRAGTTGASLTGKDQAILEQFDSLKPREQNLELRSLRQQWFILNV